MPTYDLVALVVGIHGDRGVAQHRLRPRRRDRDRTGAVGERVADEPQAALDVLVIDFEVGQRRLASRAPVDKPLGPVDDALVVKIDEDFGHGAREARVECEALAAPVARRAEPAQLVHDSIAVSLAPSPDAIDERVAAEQMAVLALLGEVFLDRVLRRDSGVVGAGQPQRVVTLHPARAHDDVLQRDVERVAEMELAGNVRRRNDDREDFALARGIGFEVAEVDPLLEPSLLSGLRIECFGQIHLGYPDRSFDVSARSSKKGRGGALRSNHIVLAGRLSSAAARARARPIGFKLVRSRRVNNIVRMLGLGD